MKHNDDITTTAGEGFEDLPGGDLVLKGMRDLEEHRFNTPEALLLQLASQRLSEAGVIVPSAVSSTRKSVESQLFERLAAQDSEAAYGNYRSYKATLDSFIRCLENRATVTYAKVVTSSG